MDISITQPNYSPRADREERYALMLKQLRSLLDGENHAVANLSNASALLNESLDHINWVGFYVLVQGELLLGPFQGNVACMHIAVGKGVCGTAVSQNVTQVVKDVHRFQGHIACDSASNSEIVIPLRQNGKVTGVLDIDSPLLGRFDDVDVTWLEQAVRIIENSCDLRGFEQTPSIYSL